MRPISDDELLALRDDVLPVLLAGQTSGTVQLRPGLVDIGGIYGALREIGRGHDEAAAICGGEARAWLDGRRLSLPIRPVSDADLLALEAEAPQVPTADTGGLIDLGRQVRQRYQAGQAWPHAREAVGRWVVQYYGEPNPWPSSRPTHPDPIIGPLRDGDGCFADATGPRLICGQHFGDLLGQAIAFGLDHVRPALEAAAGVGAHVIRSWINVAPHPWWADKPVPSWSLLDDPGRVREVLALGADLGLTWHLASGGLATLSDADENALYDELARTISDVGPGCISLIEVCNEIGGTGDRDDRDPRELARLCDRVRRVHPSLLYSLTAAAGANEDRATIAAYTLPWMQHYYYHPLRGGHVHDKLRHLFSMGYDGEAPPVRRLGWAGEPWGTGRLVSITEHKSELDAGAMALGAAMAAMARQAWIAMGSGSVVLTDDGPVEQGPGFAEAPALIRQLPRDLMRFRVLNHAGVNRRGLRIWAARDDVRADYALHDDGRFVCVQYGPPDQDPATLVQERPTTDDTVVFACPWGRVLTGRLA